MEVISKRHDTRLGRVKEEQLFLVPGLATNYRSSRSATSKRGEQGRWSSIVTVVAKDVWIRTAFICQLEATSVLRMTEWKLIQRGELRK